ncbi:FimV/HubP family polar landmark protein [Photobacterium sp. R1]
MSGSEAPAEVIAEPEVLSAAAAEAPVSGEWSDERPVEDIAPEFNVEPALVAAEKDEAEDSQTEILSDDFSELPDLTESALVSEEASLQEEAVADDEGGLSEVLAAETDMAADAEETVSAEPDAEQVLAPVADQVSELVSEPMPELSAEAQHESADDPETVSDELDTDTVSELLVAAESPEDESPDVEIQSTLNDEPADHDAVSDVADETTTLDTIHEAIQEPIQNEADVAESADILPDEAPEIPEEESGDNDTSAHLHRDSDEASQQIEQHRYARELQDEEVTQPEDELETVQPEATLDPAWDEEVEGRQTPTINLDEFPEFDEEDALLDPEAEPWEEEEQAWTDEEAQAALNRVSEQLQLAAQAAERKDELAHDLSQVEDQATDLDEAQFSEVSSENSDDVLPEVVQENIPEVAVEQQAEPVSEQAVPIHAKSQYEYAVIDPATLPEFDEDDALHASFEEQMELEQYEQEMNYGAADEADAVRPAPEPKPEPAPALQPQPSVPQFDLLSDEVIDSAGLDMAALLAEPESDVPSMMAETDDGDEWPSFAAEESIPPMADQDPELPLTQDLTEAVELVDESGLNEVEPIAESSLNSGEPEPSVQAQTEEFEHEQWLLHESVPASELEEQELSPEESEIWGTDIPEPELESEDWGEQPSLSEETAEVEEDKQADSQLVQSQHEKEPYISIDELMKELEGEADPDLDTAPLKLDVGLDEFPDVLAGIGEIDVDGAGEYASKLDLAKAYLEMNDIDGAYFLLEDVAENGDGDVSREAANLLLKIDR